MTFVTLTRVPDATTRAAIQRDIARELPNISTIDIAVVQETISGIIRRVAWAIRFIAVFALVGGIVVLTGAIAAGRFQRARESALLRTLGATRRQTSRILLTEYAALGTLAGLTGVALGSVAAWAMTRWVFEVPFRLPVLALGVSGPALPGSPCSSARSAAAGSSTARPSPRSARPASKTALPHQTTLPRAALPTVSMRFGPTPAAAAHSPLLHKNIPCPLHLAVPGQPTASFRRISVQPIGTLHAQEEKPRAWTRHCALASRRRYYLYLALIVAAHGRDSNAETSRATKDRARHGERITAENQQEGSPLRGCRIGAPRDTRFRASGPWGS